MKSLYSSRVDYTYVHARNAYQLGTPTYSSVPLPAHGYDSIVHAIEVYVEWDAVEGGAAGSNCTLRCMIMPSKTAPAGTTEVLSYKPYGNATYASAPVVFSGVDPGAGNWRGMFWLTALTNAQSGAPSPITGWIYTRLNNTSTAYTSTAPQTVVRVAMVNLYG